MREKSRRFARVYYDDMLRDHAEVWRDDAMLATWLRLLTASEKAWPSMAELPRSAKPRTVARLMEVGMVTLYAEHHYELRGFTVDRGKRQQSASNAAAVRWQSESNASAVQYPEREEKEKETSTNAREEPWEDAWYVTGRRRPPTDKQRGVIDRYLSVMDKTGPERLARLFLENPDDPIGAAIRDLDAFREERKAAALVAEQEAANRPRIVRGKSSPTRIGEVA